MPFTAQGPACCLISHRYRSERRLLEKSFVKALLMDVVYMSCRGRTFKANMQLRQQLFPQARRCAFETWGTRCAYYLDGSMIFPRVARTSRFLKYGNLPPSRGDQFLVVFFSNPPCINPISIISQSAPPPMARVQDSNGEGENHRVALLGGSKQAIGQHTLERLTAISLPPSLPLSRPS